MQSEAQIIRTLGGLEEAVKNLAVVAAKMDDRALDERHAIYERIDELKDEVVSLISKIDHVNSKVDHIYPTVTKFEESYQRSLGAKHLGKFIWGAIISIATVLVAAASSIIQLIHSHVPSLTP